METESARPIREIFQQIAFECQESGATKWQVLKILKELEQINASDQQLKRKAAEILSKLNPEAAKTFLSFEKLKVYTSAQKREPFDRGNIIRSLLKETSISRHVAEKIGSEVEDKIKDLKIDYLNTQLIREMVNVKLLELGHEPVHNEYARLGMPVFEVKKKLEGGQFENPEILREYNWLAAVPKKPREMHFDSYIHIYNPQDYSTKIYCASKFPHGENEDIVRSAMILDRTLSKPATLRALNFALAAKQIPKKKILEKTQNFEKIHLLLNKKRKAELCLFTDFEWREMQTRKKNAIEFANAILANKNESIEPFIAVDSKYQLKLLKKSLPEKILLTNNSKERVTVYENAIIIGNPCAILQLVAINLEKIFQNSGREEKFFEKLNEISEIIEELMAKKKEILEKRNYIPRELIEDACRAVALAGLYKASFSLTPDNPVKTTDKILSLLQKRFYLTSITSEGRTNIFSNQEDKTLTQKMLLELSSRQKKDYGFAYSSSSLKEAENMLTECPCIELIQKHGEHKAQ